MTAQPAEPFDAVDSSTVGAFEAKTHLSALLARAEAGETITITKHGRPVARLVPAEEHVVRRFSPEYWRQFHEQNADLRERLANETLEERKAMIAEGRL